jgi:diguanylate cyclase (GGDEF)-like protein/PAS domain S-box-containing protein
MKRYFKHMSHGRYRNGDSVSLARLLNNLPGAVYRCLNDEHGTMEFVSEGIERLTGYPRTAFTKRSTFAFADIIHPDDRAEVGKQIRIATASRRSFRVTYRILTHGGDFKWVEEQGSAVMDQLGQVRALEGFISDITLTRNSDALLLEQAALLDHARDAIFVLDMDECITYWNKGAERLYGWAAHEVVGQLYTTVFAASASSFRNAYDTTLLQGEWQGECTQFDRLGETVEVEVQWTLVTADGIAGRRQKILAVASDIAKRKFTEASMSRLAYFDSLTELPNRANFVEQLRKALLGSAREKTIGAVMFCDLDNFKALNDSMGHAAGDQLLHAVGQRLQRHVRETDVVARLGGDEFVIMLPPIYQTYDEAALHADTVAENILASMASPVQLSGGVQWISTSVGITLICGATDSVESALMKADSAMYQAKAAGRNTFRFFDPEMQASISARLQLERELQGALIAEEFVLYYQPQMNSTGSVTGAEALIRWRRADGRLVYPLEFIRSAEASGQIVEIGRWVLSNACQMLAEWTKHPETALLSLSVNISPRQFVEANFVPMAEAIFATTGADLRRLKFELTESVLVADVRTTAAKMEYLKSLGITFSLDDFGTGYSSLSYLRKLPLDELKIDSSFMRDVLSNKNDASIVRSIIALGESLGLKVIAEGVETQGQKEFLRLAGCHAYQGFLYEKALPNERFMRYAAARH